MRIKKIGHKHGFSDASFYKRRAKYAGVDVSEAKRLLTEAHLDIHALKSVFGTKR